jgi:O-acetyl-ADP-ribose deacetylase (regulator of RNase III)
MNRIEVLIGDITSIEVDAVVNAANNSLLGGGGVDGAIHSKGGPDILKECKSIIERQGGCDTGNAVITTAGNLPSKYVIHTVGPVWHGGVNDEEKLLHNAYFNSLKIASENNFQCIAFPNISTGVYHFPKKLAAHIAITTTKNFLEFNEVPEKVTFVCFDEENYSIYCELIQ